MYDCHNKKEETTIAEEMMWMDMDTIIHWLLEMLLES